VVGAHKVHPYDEEMDKLRSAVIDRRYRRIEPPRRLAGMACRPFVGGVDCHRAHWQSTDGPLRRLQAQKKPPPENRRRSNKSVDETNYET